jgi:hypothetical protein
MATVGGERSKIVVYYAAWAFICAAAAGIAISLIHTWFFSYHEGRSGFAQTLVGDIEAALAIAAGQAAVALATGSVLIRLGRSLDKTVLLGLLIGLFNFVLNFLQMAVPATELGWVPDILILVAGTVGITLIGTTSRNNV